jgi:hypothetical protein
LVVGSIPTRPTIKINDIRARWFALRTIWPLACYHFDTVAREDGCSDAVANTLERRRPEIRVDIHREDCAVMIEQRLHELRASVVGDQRRGKRVAQCMEAAVRELACRR